MCAFLHVSFFFTNYFVQFPSYGFSTEPKCFSRPSGNVMENAFA